MWRSVTEACRGLALAVWLVSLCSVRAPCLDFAAEKEEWYTAFVSVTYVDPVTAELRTEKSECGHYGEHSPKRDAKGLLATAASARERYACDPNTRFAVPDRASAWIALVTRGNCTFRDKIRHASGQNASAVVIFNVGASDANETITMPHSGTGDVVAIMIPEHRGRELVLLLEKNVTVNMHITIGTRNLQKYVSRTSVVFVSISFIVLMIISLASLVFYYIQRFRYANARDRNQRRLGDAAKKAISQLQVRTIRKGDQETESDFDNCAVCIEGYKPNDVVRILPCRHVFHKGCVDPWLVDHRTCPMCKMNILKALGLTSSAECLEELPLDYELAVGGVALNAMLMSDDVLAGDITGGRDLGVRMVGLPQVFLDSEPITEDTLLTEQSELQPIVSSGSEASLTAGVEEYDMDTPTDSTKCRLGSSLGHSNHGCAE
ncbi:RING finger protein 150 isoform X2 [Neoarius graeffei]|uniref:RING finger protein 150 isoform X2 n=1 Tax=Neoarius graeffei TaxID=443677 RepID=UPI00298C5F85|nr:RING finger protein 150 isoform X2 [Neoarius graeffei]